jgi:hypothetical protein
MMWSGDRFAQFAKIVEFLVDEKAVFMTPANCAIWLSGAREAR